MAEKPNDHSLDPDDFPVHADHTAVTTQDGETIAEAKTEKLAENIAERLNEQAAQEEEDRWSA
ncbi:conserved hypothetical protein [Rhodopseudomonas palustris HaA2]|uniref:Uncharacterized protein n=1 Tax=Rhodopseudomonas palustris (strain HaA2) TaxID=316058 RepID=Q2J244_RHOP2|nr:hypothetical protein [Rhodopseudomonas palustris]ABD05466.1 conserved hypothetical protein [Rhodopseudomonas palustris HaA2]